MAPDDRTGWEDMPTGVVTEEDLPAAAKPELPLDEPYLVVLTGASQGQRHLLGESTVIGRGASATIQVHSEDVSREHARIVHNEQGEYLLEDLGSRNGTRVNGTRVASQVLTPGDKVQLGITTVFRFAQQNPVEDKFIEAQKQQSVGRLAGGIAHDFNNLMASLLADIRYLSEHLAGGQLDRAEMAECVANMERAATRSVELTNQLLGFARQGKYESRVIDVCDLVERALEFIRGALRTTIAVDVECPEGLSIRGDMNQLNQVLINLCLNAKDAMPDGGRLFIQGELSDLSAEDADDRPPLAPGPHVVLTVRDTGLGMDDETRRRAFEPYFTTKEVGQGSGLGLAAVSGIVNNHGGHARLSSAPGKGTTVRLYFPAAGAAADDADEGQTTRTTSTLESVGGVVVVADDDQRLLQWIAGWLKDLGFRVLTAQNGQEALLQFVEHREEVKLVILDLIMPKLGGKEAFRRLRQLEPELRVIMMSGYVDEERVQDVLQEGVGYFLRKPFSEGELQAAIKQLLADAPRGPAAGRSGRSVLGGLKRG